MSDTSGVFNNYAAFMSQVAKKLEAEASRKGYAQDTEGGRELYDFVAKRLCGGLDGHGFGEVLYKLMRFQSTRNTDDLLKAAAWVFLAWDREIRRYAGKKPSPTLADGASVVREVSQ